MSAGTPQSAESERPVPDLLGHLIRAVESARLERREARRVESDHRPECWCNGTGWRTELNARCNLPQHSGSEVAHLEAHIRPGRPAPGATP